MAEKVTLLVTGMHCASCGLLIDETLEELPGVISSSTDLRRETTTVEYDPAQTDVALITLRSSSWVTQRGKLDRAVRPAGQDKSACRVVAS